VVTKSAMREMGKALDLPAEGLDPLFRSGRALAIIRQPRNRRDRLQMAGMPARHPRTNIALEVVSTRDRTAAPPRATFRRDDHFRSPAGHRSALGERIHAGGGSWCNGTRTNCEDLGIIKVDLLGLGMMSAIQDTLHWREGAWPCRSSIWRSFRRMIRLLTRCSARRIPSVCFKVVEPVQNGDLAADEAEGVL